MSSKSIKKKSFTFGIRERLDHYIKAMSFEMCRMAAANKEAKFLGIQSNTSSGMPLNPAGFLLAK